MNDPEIATIAVLGKALQNARLKASLAVEEVALQLNLAISTVRDIEDDLDNMIAEQKIPTIYLRGYIANYAKLVSLEKLDEFSEYQQLLSSQIKSGMIRPPLIPAPTKNRGKKLLLLIISLTVIGALYFAAQHFLLSKNNPLTPVSIIKKPVADSTSTQTVQHIVVTKKVISADETDQ
jgi:cytoskeleton protein RodZ